jgi:hypothetical protein
VPCGFGQCYKRFGGLVTSIFTAEVSRWLSVSVYTSCGPKHKRGDGWGGLCLLRANRESGQGNAIKRPSLWSASTPRNHPKLVFPSGHHFYCSMAQLTASFTWNTITERLSDKPAFICQFRIRKMLNVRSKWNQYFSVHFIDTVSFCIFLLPHLA